MKLGKIKRSISKWVDSNYNILSFPIGLWVILLTTWKNLTNFYIQGYKPSESHIFYGVFASYLLLYIVDRIKVNSKNKELKEAKSSYESNLNEIKESYESNLNEIKESYKSKLKQYLDSLRTEREEMLNSHLKDIFESLNFSVQQRISVYIHRNSENKEYFELVGRYSAQYDLNKASSYRAIYPIDNGILSHVWSTHDNLGSKRDNNIPERKENEEEYLNYLKNNYKIPKGTAKNFRMNPVDIYARVIRDSKDRQIGIIAFESCQRYAINQQLIESDPRLYLKGNSLIDLLEKLKDESAVDVKFDLEN